MLNAFALLALPLAVVSAGAADLNPTEAIQAIGRLVDDPKHTRSGDLKLIQITPPAAGVVAVAVDPPYREFPNVLLFKLADDGKTWVLQYEGLSLGVQDQSSGILDLHTTGEAIDFTVKGGPKADDYASLVASSRKAHNVVVAYERFFHSHHAGVDGYTLDKRFHSEIASHLVSDAYAKSYPRDKCEMYDTPPLRGVKLTESGGTYTVAAETDASRSMTRPQRWTVSFAGFDKQGMLKDKKVGAEHYSDPEAASRAIVRAAGWSLDRRCPVLLKHDQGIRAEAARTDEMVKTTKLDPSRVERYADYDLALPVSAEENAAMAESAVLLVTGITKKPDELPFSVSIGKAKLVPLVCVDEPLGSQDKLVGTLFGEHRRSCFHLVPIKSIRAKSDLTADWNGKRTGFRFGSFPLPGPLPGFLRSGVAATKAAAPRASADEAALLRFLDREYCLHK